MGHPPLPQTRRQRYSSPPRVHRDGRHYYHNSLESFDVYWDFLRHPEREPPQHKRGTLRRAHEPPPRRSHNRSVATLDSAPLTTLFTTAPVPSS